MGKIAFVFSGQGAQAPGMGFDLYNTSAAAKQVFLEADAIRPGTSGQCFEGSEEELRETVNTQPCLYTVEMAIAAAVREAGIQADVCAGFSLGELSALAYAGAYSVQDGLRLVMKRAALMQECSLAADTSMAAVIKLTNEQIEELCGSYEHIYPVNYNCPGQMSVSGDTQEMAAFADAVKEAGGRAKVLKVNGAFHSPYMTDAAVGFQEELNAFAFDAPKVPVYSNYTGKAYEGSAIAQSLSSQINHPVLWETIVRDMIAWGVDTFVELGPGKTLTGLIKRISPEVRLFNVNVSADIEKLKEEL